VPAMERSGIRVEWETAVVGLSGFPQARTQVRAVHKLESPGLTALWSERKEKWWIEEIKGPTFPPASHTCR
jgi:hypothetical protein